MPLFAWWNRVPLSGEVSASLNSCAQGFMIILDSIIWRGAGCGSSIYILCLTFVAPGSSEGKFC